MHQGGGAGLVRQPDHIRVAAAVAEELIDRVTEQAARIESAEGSLEVRPTQYALRAIDLGSGRPADEGSDRCSYPGNRPDTARNFFDIDAGELTVTGIAASLSRPESWVGRLPSWCR